MSAEYAAEFMPCMPEGCSRYVKSQVRRESRAERACSNDSFHIACSHCVKNLTEYGARELTAARQIV